MDAVEIRCPAVPLRLLLRLGAPVLVDGANMIEIACRGCKTDYRKAGQPVSLVLHRYNVMGQLVETEIQ
jgi:hypothetical protein